SADHFKLVKPQNNVIIKPISDVQPLPTIPPSADVTLQTPVPQDRWSREKHIELVKIIGEPLTASSSGTRPSHHLCSLVPSTHRSSTDSERPSHDSSSASPSRKRSRPPAASVPLSSPIHGSLSYARADLLPSPKRIRSPESATDLEDCSEDIFEPYVPREVGLEVDFEDESTEPSRSRGTDLEMDVDVERINGIKIDLEIQAKIYECIAYANALRDRGIDTRVVVEAIDREEIETGMGGSVEVRVDRVTHPVVANDVPEPAQEGAVEVTYETLGDLVQRFHDHTKEIPIHRVQAIEGM
nr:hypothetical protein [Tanacetum cinerariifolium]